MGKKREKEKIRIKEIKNKREKEGRDREREIKKTIQYTVYSRQYTCIVKIAKKV